MTRRICGENGPRRGAHDETVAGTALSRALLTFTMRDDPDFALAGERGQRDPDHHPQRENRP